MGMTRRMAGKNRGRGLAMLLVLLLGFAIELMPHDALAAAAPAGTCTTDPQFQIPEPPPGQGLISIIVTNISNVLEDISEHMFSTISEDAGFIYTVQALLTLYIAIYGIMFTFGMVQMTLYDFAIRMVKIGVIVLLLSPDAWDYFSVVVVHFFNEGTDHLILTVTNIAVGGIVSPIDFEQPDTHPFLALDGAIAKAVSAKMAVTLLATVFTGPYGLIYGLLIFIALGSFIRALFTALWVYLMSLVLRTLLFGLAPIFLCCMLFSQTRHLFDGWLNQIINACLQPILLFTFFAFFAKLIEASIDNLISYGSASQAIPVCWTEASESVRGTAFNLHYWRFMIPDSGGTMEPYGGSWTYTGPQVSGNAPIFPIDIIAVLTLFILAELANRFNAVILMIASDLAAAATNLGTMSGALSEWFSPVGKQGAGALTNVGNRIMPERTAGGVASRIGGLTGNRGGGPQE